MATFAQRCDNSAWPKLLCNRVSRNFGFGPLISLRRLEQTASLRKAFGQSWSMVPLTAPRGVDLTSLPGLKKPSVSRLRMGQFGHSISRTFSPHPCPGHGEPEKLSRPVLGCPWQNAVREALRTKTRRIRAGNGSRIDLSRLSAPSPHLHALAPCLAEKRETAHSGSLSAVEGRKMGEPKDLAGCADRVSIRFAMTSS